MDLQYWHWLVFGMILIIAELFIPSFTIFWFGLGALAVGGLLWVVPAMGLTAQLLLWALFSALLTAFWFLFMKPRMQDKSPAGRDRPGHPGARRRTAGPRPLFQAPPGF
jgi:membrane protein implicated in regulation of membrane protease activity